MAFEATSLGPASPVGYVFASSLVPVLAPVTAYAAASFPPGGGIVAGAVDLMHRIRHDFKYDPKATVISTPLREVFEKRHGVCQDFAHVMIAGLRGLGLPAAYVSGYLRTIPPPGQPRLQGADATHAWVSVWCGADIGWIGFDPTNDLMVENDHIILAIGRDFSDVSPVDGIIVGSRKQKLARRRGRAAGGVRPISRLRVPGSRVAARELEAAYDGFTSMRLREERIRSRSCAAARTYRPADCGRTSRLRATASRRWPSVRWMR